MDRHISRWVNLNENFQKSKGIARKAFWKILFVCFLDMLMIKRKKASLNAQADFTL